MNMIPSMNYQISFIPMAIKLIIMFPVIIAIATHPIMVAFEGSVGCLNIRNSPAQIIRHASL